MDLNNIIESFISKESRKNSVYFYPILLYNYFTNYFTKFVNY